MKSKKEEKQDWGPYDVSYAQAVGVTIATQEDGTNILIPDSVICPECGKAEMEDIKPFALVLSVPPKVRTHCPQCGFKSLRPA